MWWWMCSKFAVKVQAMLGGGGGAGWLGAREVLGGAKRLRCLRRLLFYRIQVAWEVLMCNIIQMQG